MAILAILYIVKGTRKYPHSGDTKVPARWGLAQGRSSRQGQILSAFAQTHAAIWLIGQFRQALSRSVTRLLPTGLFGHSALPGNARSSS